MHDIMHDLALYVAGEESIVMSGTTSMNMSTSTRHLSVEECESEVALLKVKRLHSFLMMKVTPICNQTALDKLFQNFKVLRTLSLKRLGIKEMLPSSVGELKLLRYLDLSFNEFKVLPDSMTNLVNLLAVNLSYCTKLKALPEKCQKLINLKYLNNKGCLKLEKMPKGIGKLTCLEYLSEFVVWKGSGLDAFDGLHQQLRGELLIKFRDGIDDEDECNWKLPVFLQRLQIESYPGVRIPNWGTINGVERAINHLKYLKLYSCKKVKRLPPLHCLPNLRWLYLEGLRELEFVESEEDYSTSSSPFFPRLEKLRLMGMPSLKRWRKKTTPTTPLAFPLLSNLHIQYCRFLELASFPQCPRLKQIYLWEVDNGGGDMQHRPPLPSTLFCPSVSPPPLREIMIKGCNWLSSLQVEASSTVSIFACSGLKSLQLASPHLLRVRIFDCHGLVSIEAVAMPSLSFGAPLDALEELEITGRPELDFLKLQLDWDSLVNLRKLVLGPMPPWQNIPLSLRNRQALGALHITRG